MPRLESLLCDYMAYVSLSPVHKAIKALGDIAAQAPMNLCDSWQWPVLDGELCTASDLQTTFTMNGVLLTITADIKTPTGIQVGTHY